MQPATMSTRYLRPLRVAVSSTRAYHTPTPLRLPYKDSQDRESLKPQRAEQTKSSRDDDLSAVPKTAFHKGGNSPEASRRSASQEEGGDPLEASGANQELSKPQGDEGGKNHGAGKEVNKGGRSGGGVSTKRGSS